MTFSFAQGPCNVTTFPSQIALDSDFAYTSMENATIIIKELTSGWPNGTAPGLDDDEDHSSGVLFAQPLGPGDTDYLVTSATTPLGLYQFERDELGSSGCLDTVTVEVVMTLPVVWLDPAVAEIKNGKAALTFSTAQQINNSHFEVEHSQDGNQYQTIGKIEGEGHTNREIDYKFIHESPSSGINYYRVKQVDLDGQYSFSNVASVIYRTDEVNVYPNPVRDLLTVSLPNQRSVAIYNHLGQQVCNYYLEEGENVVDMASLESGLYLLKFDDGRVERVVKR